MAAQARERRKKSSRGYCSREGKVELKAESCRLKAGFLRFQIGHDPIFHPLPPLVGRVEAHPEALVAFLPSDVPAHPDARQRQQRKRHFHQTSSFGHVIALERHSPRTALLAGGGHAAPLAPHNSYLSHDSESHLTAAFAPHPHSTG